MIGINIIKKRLTEHLCSVKIIQTWLLFRTVKEEELIKTLGQVIARLRREANMTQFDLASNIGIEESALRRVEIGKTNPTTKTLYLISRGLGVTISQLFEFENKPTD